MYYGQKLLLIVVNCCYVISILMSAYYQQLSNAVEQFWLRPILTDRLTPPATGQLLIMYSILLRHIFPCYSSCVWGCMGFLYGWCKHLFVSELNNSYLPDKYFEAVCTVAKSYTTVCFDYCLSVAFLSIDISQDSVAPCLRCGGIFKNDFIANLPLSLRVKKFENRLTFGEVTGKSMVSCFFWLAV